MSKMKRDKIILCEGLGKDGKEVCPKRENCAFYCVGFDKAKTFHYAYMPFRNGKCAEFQERDIDTIIRNSLNKNSN